MTEKEERLPTHPLAKHMPSNEWLRDKIESDPDDAEVEVRPSGAYTDAVHEFAMSYESRDPDYTPTDHERALIEDAINSFIAEPPARSIDAGDGWVLPDDCDGIEQDAFEAWAAAERYDMEQHPLHWLFLNARTAAARNGWRAGIRHARDRYRAMLAAAPPPAAKEAE